MQDWRHRARDASRAVTTDFGTVSLGAAAILLTRAIPSPSFDDLNFALMGVSISFALLGIILRLIARP